MISGGEEVVLVIWQLSTGDKNFLPRLDGALLCRAVISPDGTHFAITCADNTLRMISAAELKEEWRVHGLALTQFNMPLSDTLRTGLIIEPKINWLVLNGPGDGVSLQFYSLNLKKHITQMDIVSRNVVSRVNKEPLTVVRVAKVVFSADGKYMATIDSALHAHGKCMHSLKFWKRTDVKWKQVEDTSSAGLTRPSKCGV